MHISQNSSKELALMNEIIDNNPQFAKKIDRNELLKMSSWLVENLQGRLSRPRFIVQDTDPVKLQYYRVLIQAVQTHNSILRDEELDDIKTRMALIEATLEGRK
jgi:hypothetical protein